MNLHYPDYTCDECAYQLRNIADSINKFREINLFWTKFIATNSSTSDHDEWQILNEIKNEIKVETNNIVSEITNEDNDNDGDINFSETFSPFVVTADAWDVPTPVVASSPISEIDKTPPATPIKKRIRKNIVRELVAGEFTCDICNEIFLFKKDLPFHMHSKHSKSRRFMCPICPTLWQNNNILQKHIVNKHRSDEERVADAKCLYCNEQFSNGRELSRHVSTVHSGVDTFMCDTCGISLNSYRSLARHLKNHQQFPPLPAAPSRYAQPVDFVKPKRKVSLWCPVCKSGFYVTAVFRRHIKKHDDGNEIWQQLVGRICSKCHKMFPSKECLADHSVVHKSWICDVCKGGFTSKQSLMAHSACHKNEKERPFSCPVSKNVNF